jgi:hypothetical protein
MRKPRKKTNPDNSGKLVIKIPLINFSLHLARKVNNMEKWFILLVFLFLYGCSPKEADTYLSPDKANWYFREIKAICDRDNGKLWGKNIYGPLMFVDRPTRKISSSMPDREGLLKMKEGIYSGIYPRELIIENTDVIYGGTMFGMVPLPPREDTARIEIRAIHGLFHCFQEVSGLQPATFAVKLMDEKNSRLWLKLEWRALKKAIISRGEQRCQALRDALIFRGARREQNPTEITDENKFEAYEGLSTLTSTIFCNNSREEAQASLLANLDRFYRFQSYSRSYGFIHGALYGWLAYEKNFDFSTIKSDTIDLAYLAKELYGIQLPVICRDVAGSLALGYDIGTIYNEEEQRLARIKERIHRQISAYTEKPVVYIELESPYFDFEPEEIQSLDTLGTIYNSIRVSDNWGKLTVDKGGCLVSYNLKSIRIPTKNIEQSKNHITANGWHLILNDDWQMVKEDGNYFIRKVVH